MKKLLDLTVSETNTVVCLVEMSAKKFVNMFATFIVLVVLALATPRAFAQDIDPELKAAIDAEVAGEPATESKSSGFLGGFSKGFESVKSETGRQLGKGASCFVKYGIWAALVARAGRDADAARKLGMLTTGGCVLLSNFSEGKGGQGSAVNECLAENDDHRRNAAQFYSAGHTYAGNKEMQMLRRCDDRRDRNGGRRYSVFYGSY